ncbi:MAG: DinB family protein [Actinomycetota bacterium]|nr:DinB family protein [Actinomycetota bacterium]
MADTKDWTWVLDRACGECDFDSRTVTPEQVALLIAEVARVWVALVESTPEAALRERPAPDRWSTLEYACHVRDVCKVMDSRLALLLVEEDPEFANWDQDATAVADRYDAQDPRTVAIELVAAADAIAERIAAVQPEQWSRTGRRSDGARFSAGSLMRYFLHDPVHHLHDVGIAWQPGPR